LVFAYIFLNFSLLNFMLIPLKCISESVIVVHKYTYVTFAYSVCSLVESATCKKHITNTFACNLHNTVANIFSHKDIVGFTKYYNPFKLRLYSLFPEKVIEVSLIPNFVHVFLVMSKTVLKWYLH